MRKKPLENLFPQYPHAFTVNHLCSALKIAHRTAYKLIRNGEIKSFRVGHQIRILKSEVENYVNNAFLDVG